MNEMSNSMVERIENYAHLKHFMESLNDFITGRGPSPLRYFGSHEDIDVERRLVSAVNTLKERVEQAEESRRRNRQIPKFAQNDEPINTEYSGIDG